MTMSLPWEKRKIPATLIFNNSIHSHFLTDPEDEQPRLSPVCKNEPIKPGVGHDSPKTPKTKESYNTRNGDDIACFSKYVEDRTLDERQQKPQDNSKKL
jgi:hypothetical protein